MKRQVGRDMNRVQLHTVVPLKIPFAIGIGASDVCNFKCIYCSQATKEGIKGAQIISFEQYKKILQQIKLMCEAAGEKIRILRYIGNGEPLLNRNLPEMIRLAVDEGISTRYEVTTNGSMLTHELSEQLVEAGMTRLLISIQGVSTEDYIRVCGKAIDVEKLRDEIAYFYSISRGKCTVYIKATNASFKCEDDEKLFYDIFGPISDEISVENIIPSSEGIEFSSFLTESDLQSTRYHEDLKHRIVCDSMFTNLNIHSNGDVDCCGCIYPPLFIGNVYKEDLINIWNGEKHIQYMEKHLLGKRSEINPCSHCESIERQNCFEEDNLDPYRATVFEKVQKIKKEKQNGDWFK